MKWCGHTAGSLLLGLALFSRIAAGELPVRPLPGTSKARACPKILMFDGLDIRTQNEERWARYWGESIGVDGFFVNGVMPSWLDSVGEDESSALFESLIRFQQLYSRHGVSENFIKVSLYKGLDWNDAAVASKIVTHFRQAARLARKAGLRGLALDLEPYVKGYWEENPGLPDKGERVLELGRRIGRAIVEEFPQAHLIVLPEVLTMVSGPYSKQVQQAYWLAPSFWRGLIQARFAQLIVGTEKSYSDSRPDVVAWDVGQLYRESVESVGLDPERISVAIGLWPLGLSYEDKRARMTPVEFEQRLRLAVLLGSPYVWIYGHGSAWQTDGPYGKGEVDPAFGEYVQALQRVKDSCRPLALKGDSQPNGPTSHNVLPGFDN